MRHVGARVRSRQRRNQVGDFAGDAQRLAAGREYADLRSGLKQPVRKVRTGRNEVLAIVEHEQQRALLDVAQHGLDDRPAGVFLDAKCRGNRLRHELRIRQRSEFDEPHAIRKAIEHDVGELKRQAGLADPAGSEQGQQARCLQQLVDVFEYALPTDE